MSTRFLEKLKGMIGKKFKKVKNKLNSAKPHFLQFHFSIDSGWDNPFRPDGDLSREADEIVNLIKG